MGKEVGSLKVISTGEAVIALPGIPSAQTWESTGKSTKLVCQSSEEAVSLRLRTGRCYCSGSPKYQSGSQLVHDVST